MFIRSLSVVIAYNPQIDKITMPIPKNNFVYPIYINYLCLLLIQNPDKK
jgi:hypothetical protein